MIAKLVENKIRVYDAFLHKDALKEIEGRYYDSNDKAWCLPLSEQNIALLTMLGIRLDESLKAAHKPESTALQKEAPLAPMQTFAKPYMHQIRAYNFALTTFMQGPGVAILADMGTGKSLMTIAITGRLYQEKKVVRLLVVAPKSIVGVWDAEFGKFADYNYTLTVLEGCSDKKAAAIKEMQGDALQIIVVNYESCWRLEKEIAKWHPDMIVCDESSKIKNPQAKQSKALHRLGKAASYRMILTGTPVINNPLDLFSQYKFLDEKIFGASYYSFRAKYAVMGGYGNHQVIGYRNISELVEKVHEIAFRIKIEDAVDLPEYIDDARVLSLEPEAHTVYDSIDRDSYAELISGGEITTRNVLTRLLRLSQCTGGFIRSDTDSAVRQISKIKLQALEDIIDSCIDESRKVVVFARFVPEIEAIDKMLKKKAIGYSLIMGNVKDRAEQVSRFQTDPNIKVFVGQLQTTGMGLTLTAASVAVYYSLDFSYANYQQSRARIHRIGQTEKCLYIHLICKGTVDERIMSALKAKADIAKLLVDDYKKLLHGGNKI